MRSKQPNSGRRSPYGPNIVRAWFDTVFQYALQGLETEQSFLSRRNWTFRFRIQTRLSIWVRWRALACRGPRNLEQFVSFFPEVGEKVSEHDGCEHGLEDACRSYFAAILDSSDFHRAFEDVAAETPKSLGVEFSRHFGAYSSQADFMAILAEYLINNIDVLPGHYTTAALWNQCRSRFLPVVSSPALSPFREATERAGTDLLVAAEGLSSLFKTTPSGLSLRFDVPYVAELISAR